MKTIGWIIATVIVVLAALYILGINFNVQGDERLLVDAETPAVEVSTEEKQVTVPTDIEVTPAEGSALDKASEIEDVEVDVERREDDRY